jgi:UDP-glucose 4-epimerase
MLQSRVFKIASGNETGILKVAKIMQELTERKPEFKFQPPRLGDPYRGVADITRTRRELGFNSQTSLRDGLSATMRWYQNEQ